MRWRFLLFVLIAAAVPPVAAMLLTAYVATTAEGMLDQHLTAASSALQGRLETDAVRRREMLLRLSLLPDISGPVHDAAEAGQAPPASVVTKVQQVIASQFSNETADFVAVATAQGAVAVVTTGEQHGKAFSFKVSEIPVAEEALRGVRGSGFHSFEGTLYRFSAVPVGIADAAIIVGDRVSNATVARWRNEIRADMTIVSGGRVIASSLKGAEKAAVAGAVERPNQLFGSGDFNVGLPLGPLKDVFPLFVHHGARRSLAKDAGGAFTVVTINSDLAWVAQAQLGGLLLGLGLLVIGVIWSQVVYGPVIRQARSIEAHLARLRAERGARLTKKGFSPPFTALAELLDRLVDHWNREAATATTTSTPPVARETPVSNPSEISRPMMRAPVELPLATQPTPAGHDAVEGTPAFPFADAFGRAAKAAARVATDDTLVDGVAPVRSRPPAGADLAATNTAFPAVANPRSQPRSTPNAAESGGTSVPPELLARVKELENEMLEGAVDPDDAHYQAVFDEFVSARERCGEKTDGLTLERFAVRLRKNRDQLVEKYACKSVRFQVYVKDGKAAVKALPVR